MVTEHDPPRPVLIVSRPKSGKRTLVRALAKKLDLAFLEVSLGGSSGDLSCYLFGDGREGEGGEGQGALGRSPDTVLYFSDLHMLPQALHISFYRLIAEGSYQSPRGAMYLPKGCTLIAGLDLGVTGVEVTPEHWVSSGFAYRLTLQEYRGPRDGRDLVASMLGDLGSTLAVEDTVGDLFTSLRGTAWNLADLRGWIQAALRVRPSDAQGPLVAEEIRRALLEDAAIAFESASYRGMTAPRDDLERWLDQFPVSLRVEALHLAREAATTYFFSTERYFKALRHLVSDSGIKVGARVTFCRFDRLGKSGAHVAHDLKNMARWQPTEDVDCGRPRETWPDLNLQETSCLLIVDDFVGSGQSLARSLRGFQQGGVPRADSPLVSLLEAFPAAQVLVLVVCGLRKGLQRVQRILEEVAGARARLVAYKILDDHDRCFLPASRILPDPEVRERMRDFLVEAAEQRLRGIRGDHRLGYDNGQVLVVFYNTVPNNTLPHIWFDADPSSWYPLFPASETTRDLLADSGDPAEAEEGGASRLQRLWRYLTRRIWRPALGRGAR